MLLTDNLRVTAERHPQRCAIQHGETELSYAQLAQRAESFAAHLLSRGLEPGERVALLMDNSPDYAAALYGTLLAGGIAVTLNAAAKAREFAAWLRHSEASWLVTEGDRREAALAIAEIGTSPKLIIAGATRRDERLADGESLEAVLASNAVATTLPTLSADAPACILYTSGTTGNPKGVVLTHGNLASNTAAIVRYLELTATDSIVSILPFYYSYGSSILHTHIRAGARIVLENNLVYPHLVVERLASNRVTGFAGVPSTFALLLQRVELARYDLSALRYLTQAGGAMAPVLTRRLRETLPRARLFVMYGQTEATARLTYLPPERLEDKLGSVGIPVDGVSVEIRNDEGNPLPRLQPGEVWIRGPNVMQGYWRDEAATRSVLRDSWLRTGDMGHLDEEGFLYLSGRRSDMIKTGAHRVHPNDVEEVIQELGQVAEVAVVGIDDETLGQAIAAFIVPAPGQSGDALQIRNHCRARLASYKVPKTIEFVTALPRTASGKVRRVELAQRNSP